MKNAEKIGALAAMVAAVFCACETMAGGIEPVDWSVWRGKTYTVPADTTNEVTSADFAAANAVSTIVFENEYSALLVTTSSIPNSVKYQGPGSVIFTQKVLLPDGDTIVRRTLGAGDGGNFVKFIFRDGIDTIDGGGENFYYWYNGSYYSETNATLYLDGRVTNVTFRGAAELGYNGRFDFGESIDIVLNQGIATKTGTFGVIRQRGGSAFVKSYYIEQTRTSYAAYLLEGGSLTVHNGDTRWYVYGPYLHFRQTGGTFDCHCWQRPDSQNDANTIPSDFIYGGSAVATCAFEDSTPMFIGPLNVAVMDNATVNAGWLRTSGTSEKYLRNVAVNGGMLAMDTRYSEVGRTHFSFNGGTLMNMYEGASMFGNNNRYDNPVWARIYENGGCIYNNNSSTSDGQYLYLPHLKAPVGNVVLRVGMTDELRNKTWQMPPSVEIKDSTGSGSNAVAIVDYNFDSGKVTNITVICQGENYSDAEGVVTANLRYRNGDELLSTPLVCEVGPCVSGGVTLAGGKAIYAGGITNTYVGATTIDMDRTGEYDHPSAKGQEATYHSFIIKQDGGLFSSTSVVVRSGNFFYDADPSSDLLSKYFPDCTRIELYGGHFSKWIHSCRDLVVGGECWLVNHNLDYRAYLSIPADGTLTVDFGAVVTNGVPVTPKLKYGTFTFSTGSQIVLKKWDSLPRGKKVVALDMSEVATKNDFNLPTVVQNPDEGILS